MPTGLRLLIPTSIFTPMGMLIGVTVRAVGKKAAQDRAIGLFEERREVFVRSARRWTPMPTPA